MFKENLAFFATSALFLTGLVTSMVSIIGNRWYSVDLTTIPRDEIVIPANSTLYVEGLLSACWFDDCELIHSKEAANSLGEVYFASVMMIIAMVLEWVCLVIKILKGVLFKATPVGKIYVNTLGTIELCAGALSLSAPGYYFRFHNLAKKGLGMFEYCFYLAWVSGGSLVLCGFLTFFLGSYIIGQTFPIDDRKESENKGSKNSDDSFISKALQSVKEADLVLTQRRQTV